MDSSRADIGHGEFLSKKHGIAHMLNTHKNKNAKWKISLNDILFNRCFFCRPVLHFNKKPTQITSNQI